MGRDFCNETERQSLISLFKRDMDIRPLYTYLCPVIIFVCFFSIIFNAILMSISRQSKFINKSPILLLSLNLAVTDLIASLLNGLGILFNSYLPEVFDIKMGQCSMLMFEVVRCAALIASALHLLALAFVHYRGIVNPLHYRSTLFFSQHLSRTINIISIFCWLIPLTIMIVWFSSTPCQGFQTAECDYLFLLGSAYRYMVLSVFLLPLVLMSVIYVRIFIIISRHQRGRRLEQERSTLTRGVISVAGPVGSAAAGVNLPELMSKSSLEQCPVCSGNKRRLDSTDEKDELDGDETVSMLSEPADSMDENGGLDKRRSVRVVQTNGESASAVSSRLLCDSNQASDHEDQRLGCDDDSGRQSRATTAAVDGNETDTCRVTGGETRSSNAASVGGSLNPDKTLVFVLNGCDGSSDETSGNLITQVAAPIRHQAMVKIRRAETNADSSAACHGPDETVESPGGFEPSDQAPAQTAISASRSGSSRSQIERDKSRQSPGGKPPAQSCETLRAKFSLGARDTVKGGTDASARVRLTYDQKSSSSSDGGGGGHGKSSQSTSLKHSNVANGDGAAAAAADDLAAATIKLENLLHKKCTCDNKLRQQRRAGVKLARANTIGFNGRQQRTGNDKHHEPSRGSPATPSTDLLQPKAVVSSLSSGTGPSISSGFAPARPALKLQLRRSPTSPASAGTNKDSGAILNKNYLTANPAASGPSGGATHHSTTAVLTRSESNFATQNHQRLKQQQHHQELLARQSAASHHTGALADTMSTVTSNRTINNTNTANTTTIPSPSMVSQQQQQQRHEPTRRHVHASAVPQTNTKALITTLLILGTYFVSYAPAIIYQVLTCIDHCPYPLYDISYGRRVLFGAMTTLLLIAKSIVDPLIYSYRMNEIQMAISRYLSKRRSKTSSHGASMHTSQRFTFNAGASTTHMKQHHSANNSHHHQSFRANNYTSASHGNNANNRTQSSMATSSFRILNSARASLRANVSSTPRATSKLTALPGGEQIRPALGGLAPNSAI